MGGEDGLYCDDHLLGARSVYALPMTIKFGRGVRFCDSKENLPDSRRGETGQ